MSTRLTHLPVVVYPHCVHFYFCVHSVAQKDDPLWFSISLSWFSISLIYLRVIWTVLGTVWSSLLHLHSLLYIKPRCRELNPVFILKVFSTMRWMKNLHAAGRDRRTVSIHFHPPIFIQMCEYSSCVQLFLVSLDWVTSLHRTKEFLSQVQQFVFYLNERVFTVHSSLFQGQGSVLPCVFCLWNYAFYLLMCVLSWHSVHLCLRVTQHVFSS